MRLQHMIFLGLGLAVIGAAPALAYQGRGAGGQGRPQAGAMQGATQQDRLRDRDRDQVYGWQLMTPAERSAYRQKMRNLKTSREREALRKQHHEEMQKRAQERGMTLPDMPRHDDGAGPATRQRTEERTEERTEQQERNKNKAQEIKQQRTQQQDQQSQGHGS